MTPVYCLNREQLHRLLELSDESLLAEDLQLWNLLEECRNWYVELISLTYFVAMILQRRLNREQEVRLILDKLEVLQNDMWFTFQEMDDEFISYTFQELRQVDLDLEENLREIQVGLSERRYSKTKGSG